MIKDCEFAIDKILCNGSTYVASQQFFKEVIYYLRHYVEVVRCKECRKRGTCECPLEETPLLIPRDNWYCAEGERRSK